MTDHLLVRRAFALALLVIVFSGVAQAASPPAEEMKIYISVDMEGVSVWLLRTS